MEMQKEVQGDVLVLKISGEVMGGEDLIPFQETIHQSIQDGLVNAVADLSDVKWMNSSGLGMLMAGLTTLRSSDGDLKLACVSERVQRPMKITRLDQVFEIYESLQSAVASFEGD